jgi:hypothetical protein
MPAKFRANAKFFLLAIALGLAYAAGAASSNPQAVASLNQSADLLVKAHAVLGSIQSRASYGSVESAKAKINGALADIETAVKQNGG